MVGCVEIDSAAFVIMNLNSRVSFCLRVLIGASQSILWHRNESLIKGLYAWLAILSFLILLVLVWGLVLCCLYSQLRREAQQVDSDMRAFKQINAFSN